MFYVSRKLDSLIITNLFYRAYNISSNYFLFHLELDFLKQYFFNNGYSRHILDTHINKFLDNKFLLNVMFKIIGTLILSLFYTLDINLLK